MAFRRRLGRLAETFLDQHLARRRAEHQSALVGARQREMEGINTDQQLLGRILQDPELARRIAAQRPRVAGQDTSLFIPTEDQMSREAATEIGKVTDLNALPTQEDLQGRFGGRVPIETLLTQAEARKKALQGAMTPIRQGIIGPDGTKQDTFINPFEAKGQTFQTERTGAQEGAREGAIATGAAPGKVEAENTFNRGTQASAAARQGAISRASADATNASETAQLNDPRFQQGRANVIMAEEKAKAAAAKVILDTDPTVGPLAEAVIRDPALLSDRTAMTPSMRQKVLAVASGDPRFKTARQASMQKILDTAWTALDRTASNTSGMEGATGLRAFDPSRWTWSGEPIQGTEAGDWATDFDQLKSALTLPNLEYLRGLGHMSDREFATVSQASTSLDRNRMGEKKMQDTLILTKDILKQVYERAGLTPPTDVGAGATSAAKDKLNRLRGGG